MNKPFLPLSSDCVDFYDIDPARLAALSQLATARIDRDAYVKLQLPIAMGRLRPDAAEKFVPTTDAGNNTNITKFFEEYSRTSVDELSGDVSRAVALTRAREGQPAPAHEGALPNLARALIDFDRRYIGGNSAMLRFVIDDQTIGPQKMRAPLWHMDHEKDQALPQPGEDAMLPQTLSPLVRGYAFRLTAPGDTENAQFEYIDDIHLLDKGRPHPLVLRAAQAAQEGYRLKAPYRVGNFGLAELIARDKEFAAKWGALTEASRKVDAEMRAEGLIKQPAPGEILLATNYTFHRSHQPTRNLPSLFYGFQAQTLG